jgi:hypothetical protein
LPVTGAGISTKMERDGAGRNHADRKGSLGVVRRSACLQVSLGVLHLRSDFKSIPPSFLSLRPIAF